MHTVEIGAKVRRFRNVGAFSLSFRVAYFCHARYSASLVFLLKSLGPVRVA